MDNEQLRRIQDTVSKSIDEPKVVKIRKIKEYCAKKIANIYLIRKRYTKANLRALYADHYSRRDDLIARVEETFKY